MTVPFLAGPTVVAAAEQGGQAAALYVAVFALLASVGAAAFGFETVQADNAKLRARVELLEARDEQRDQQDRMRDERIATLEDLLRRNGLPVPPPLRFAQS